MNKSLKYKEFKKTVVKQSKNEKLQQTLNNSLQTYYTKYLKGINQFENLSELKNKIYLLKKNTINNLDQYLLEFENNFRNNGGEIYWADNSEEALQLVEKILNNNSSLVVKSKSMLTEEIELNSFLESKNIKVVETDLGEYIIQLRKEKPSHITAPALHLSKKEIAELFHKEFSTNVNASAEEITYFVRNLIRKEFINADTGISGANFLVADIGSIALTENEGNASLVTAWPKTHIVISGIEKIIPSFKDLSTLWPLLSSHATGQNISVYNHLISGPRQDEEQDGPEKMFLILLNNNRDNILIDKELRQATYCIKCGACSNVCPVYKIISGHSYDTVYNGPIGSVISPHLNKDESFYHLSFASSLCGKCTEICPVNIPLDNLLLYNRNIAVKNQKVRKSEIRAVKLMSRMLKSRKKMDILGGNSKNLLFKLLFKKSWGAYRTYPEFSKESFNKQYQKKEKKFF